MVNKISVGNAPCSWGTLEFKGYNNNPIDYVQMLDELVETGFTATELGDWGFMPTEPALLKEEIEKRKLRMLGAFVQAPFRLEKAFEESSERVMRVARLLYSALESHKPYIILSDDNATDPTRTRYAGRVTKEMGLSNSEWRVFTNTIQNIARQVKHETGFQTLFHHHSAGFVETPEEIKHFLELTDSSLINLVFDTGHFIFGSGEYENIDIIAALENFRDRISYYHFKDLDPDIAKQARLKGWDYFESLKNGVFCELGKGCVDFRSIVEWLKNQDYLGWVLIEQDVLPGMGDPKYYAKRNRDYLKSIGI